MRVAPLLPFKWPLLPFTEGSLPELAELAVEILFYSPAGETAVVIVLVVVVAAVVVADPLLLILLLPLREGVPC